MILGLIWTAYSTVEGAVRYSERASLQQRVEAVEQKQAQGLSLSGKDAAVAKSWAELEQRFRADPKELAADRDKRLGPFPEYASYMQDVWLERARELGIFFRDIPEAFCAMLIGAALFKWGIIQGRRTRRFYLLMMLATYAIGLSLRVIEVQQHLTYAPGPRVVWFTQEIARMTMTLGHVALVSLILGSATGRRLLAPFKAAGRIAFSLYVMQTLLTMWLLFPGFGLGLWGRFGWAGMTAITLAIIAGQLLLANAWLRYFGIGPVEWLWRSLVYAKLQPFKRPAARVSRLPA